MNRIIGTITTTMVHLLVWLLVFLLAAGNCLATAARDSRIKPAPNLSVQPHRQKLKISTQTRQENRENKSKRTSDIAYDADGNRVSKTIGQINADKQFVGATTTTFYLVDTNNLTGYAQVVEELVDAKVVKRYSFGHDLISQSQKIDGQFVTHWYGYDGHGSVRFLTDAAGAVTDTYDYDAFGILINSTGTTPNNYLYAGEQFDHDLGLSYNRARYLNLNTGRFFTQDSYEGGNSEPLSLHKYLYAHANPVNNIDPSGKITIATIAVGVLLVTAALTLLSIYETSSNMARYGLYLDVENEPIIIDNSGWTQSDVERGLKEAYGVWFYQARIAVKSAPIRTINDPTLLDVPDPKGTPTQTAKQVELLLDKIKPTKKHVTVFTRSAGGFGGLDPGWSTLGVAPSTSKYPGTSVSFIGNTLYPASHVIAHEWAHTFGIPDPPTFFGVPFTEVKPNIVNSIINVPALTPGQRNRARDYVSKYY